MTLGERIRLCREEKDLTQQEVADWFKISRNAVSVWENNKGEPEGERLRKLAVKFEVEFDWLATGRGDKVPTPPGIPEKGAVSGGIWREVEETQDVAEKTIPVAPDPRYPKSAQYALRVEGNSVNRVAKPGSLVHCVDLQEAALEVRSGDLVVAERSKAGLIETTVKRFDSRNGKPVLRPESDDPSHQTPLEIGSQADGSEISVKAIVIQVITPIARGA